VPERAYYRATLAANVSLLDAALAGGHVGDGGSGETLSQALARGMAAPTVKSALERREAARLAAGGYLIHP
jgi:hypothetical protein